MIKCFYKLRVYFVKLEIHFNFSNGQSSKTEKTNLNICKNWLRIAFY